jgi:hypothetical protein
MCVKIEDAGLGRGDVVVVCVRKNVLGRNLYSVTKAKHLKDWEKRPPHTSEDIAAKITACYLEKQISMNKEGPYRDPHVG